MGMILLDLAELLLLSHGATQISAEPQLKFWGSVWVRWFLEPNGTIADTECSSTQLFTVACKGETYTITGLVSPWRYWVVIQSCSPLWSIISCDRILVLDAGTVAVGCCEHFSAVGTHLLRGMARNVQEEWYLDRDKLGLRYLSCIPYVSTDVLGRSLLVPGRSWKLMSSHQPQSFDVFQYFSSLHPSLLFTLTTIASTPSSSS